MNYLDIQKQLTDFLPKSEDELYFEAAADRHEADLTRKLLFTLAIINPVFAFPIYLTHQIPFFGTISAETVSSLLVVLGGLLIALSAAAVCYRPVSSASSLQDIFTISEYEQVKSEIGSWLSEHDEIKSTIHKIHKKRSYLTVEEYLLLRKTYRILTAHKRTRYKPISLKSVITLAPTRLKYSKSYNDTGSQQEDIPFKNVA